MKKLGQIIKTKFSVTFPNGKVLITEGFEGFCRKHGLQADKAREAMNAGTRCSYKGFRFERIGDKIITKPRKIRLIHPSGKKEIFPSIKSAEKAYGLNPKAIREVISGRQNHHHGFKVELI